MHGRAELDGAASMRSPADVVELLITLGRTRLAADTLEVLEEWAAAPDRHLPPSASLRSRALLALARGDVDAALELLRRALDADTGGASSERARTLLAVGNALRRGGRGRESRAPLERAREIFDEQGEAAWAARCREELAMLRRPAPRTGLTPAERRVAEQVVTGLTNCEVAARLRVSQRAVEMHLSSVYRKLDVRSRIELAVLASTRGLEAGSAEVRQA